MNSLTELREELEAKRGLLDQVFSEAKAENDDGEEVQDFREVSCLGKAFNELEGAEKTQAIVAWVKQANDQILDLDERISTAEAVEMGKSLHDHFGSKRRRYPVPSGASFKDHGVRLTARQISERVVNDPQFKRWQQGEHGRIDIDAAWGDAVMGERKTLMSTSAGFPPESTRTGVVVDIPLRPPQVIDIMPRGTTGQALVVYMQQTTRTQAAVEIAEGASKPEATFVFAEASSPVQEIAVSLPVTNTQLEDVPFVAGLIEGMLREDIVEHLDGQILAGSGTPPSLEGILNTTGILTQAVGADPIIDAIFKAGTKIRTGAARATPTHVLLHPTDWEKVRLIRGSDGKYLFGDPQEQVVPRVWGWPIVLNESLAVGTGLIGGFATRNIQLVERRGVSVERGLSGTDFIQNRQTLRASMRAANVVFRPAAFATITGIV